MFYVWNIGIIGFWDQTLNKPVFLLQWPVGDSLCLLLDAAASRIHFHSYYTEILTHCNQ